jgi:hypothetical protein
MMNPSVEGFRNQGTNNAAKKLPLQKLQICAEMKKALPKQGFCALRKSMR